MAEVTIHNLDVVISNIRSFGGGFESYMNDVLMRVVREDVWPKWIEHISLTDHSLEALRKLGHPYSVRFGADSFMHPDDMVHQQSGDLVSNSRIVPSRDIRGNAVAIVNYSAHYVFLRYGTTKMRLRDPGGKALAEALPAIRKRFASEVKAAVVKFFAS